MRYPAPGLLVKHLSLLYIWSLSPQLILKRGMLFTYLARPQKNGNEGVVLDQEIPPEKQSLGLNATTIPDLYAM